MCPDKNIGPSGLGAGAWELPRHKEQMYVVPNYLEGQLESERGTSSRKVQCVLWCSR